jgi:hypothetical protein
MNAARRHVAARLYKASHEHELVEFTTLIEAARGLTQTVVPVGAGLRLAVLGRPD